VNGYKTRDRYEIVLVHKTDVVILLYFEKYPNKNKYKYFILNSNFEMRRNLRKKLFKNF